VSASRSRSLPLDAHLHTALSPDSDVPIDAYAALAIERGIAEIAITDHIDFEPGAPAFGYATFDERERIVRDAAGRWAPRGVALRFGVEVTYDRRFEPAIRAHLAAHSYDFVIGSCHVYRDSVYSAERVAGWVGGRSLGEIVEPYFTEVEAAASSGLFDALGHLDFVKRYLHPHVTRHDLARAPELYEPILRALIDSGTALEVNTSGLRQAAGESYPSPAIVALFRELGGERVTVGSDAHLVEAFAYRLEDGYDAIEAAGIEALTFRRGAGLVRIDLDGTPNGAAVTSL
jgi:histidinol-phosphatase (PHP family)